MAVLGVSAARSGLILSAGDGPLEAALADALASLPARAPVVILVHGYKFDPARPKLNPHRMLFSPEPPAASWRIRSWPVGLGLHRARAGLALGFGWAAAERNLPSLFATGKTGFACVYDRAEDAGESLAELVIRVRRLAPWRRIDVLAHSLGARVALSALPHLEQAPNRMLLLGAAEFGSRALECLSAGPQRPPAIYNISTRANDLFDALFETFAPQGRPGDRALGAGLPEPPPNWIDLQIDHPAVTEALRARGIPLKPCGARACHWSFYTRSGAFALYRAILRRRPGWDVASLRADPALTLKEPRWCRLLPRRTQTVQGPGRTSAFDPGSFAG